MSILKQITNQGYLKNVVKNKLLTCLVKTMRCIPQKNIYT